MPARPLLYGATSPRHCPVAVTAQLRQPSHRAGKCLPSSAQNIDNLHQVIGFAPITLIERHGTPTYAAVRLRLAITPAWSAAFSRGGWSPDSRTATTVTTATLSIRAGDAGGCDAASTELARASICSSRSDRRGGLAGRGFPLIGPRTSGARLCPHQPCARPTRRPGPSACCGYDIGEPRAVLGNLMLE